MTSTTGYADMNDAAAMFKILTPAAKLALGRVFSGWNGVAITYGPFDQLLRNGLITGTQGQALQLTARGFDVYLARAL